MTKVLAPYNPEVFNSLQDLEDVAHDLTMDNFRDIGKIIRRYHYEDDIDVGMAHRHFDLDKNEAMLQRGTKTKLSTIPVNLEDLKKAEAHPRTIVMGEDGQWYPIEYGLNKENPLETKFDPKFFDDVGAYLFEKQLQLKVAVCFRKTAVEVQPGEVLIEESDCATRTSEACPVKKDQVGVHDIAAWANFVDSPEGEVVMFCKNPDCPPYS